jgi:hypothetical protein
MRRKIVQPTRKPLLQAGRCCLLLSLLSTSASGWAAGWTHEFGKVKGTWSNQYGIHILVDPQAADNVNNCTRYMMENGGENVAVFTMLYPATDAPTEAQKVMISQALMAAATGKPIKIYSSACDAATANNIRQIWVNSN